MPRDHLEADPGHRTHLVAGKVDWANGKFFSGTGEVGDAVVSSLRQSAARRARDEAEIESARDRARAMQARAVPSGDGPPGAAATPPLKHGPRRAKKLGAADAGGAAK